jgi:xanthine dehydrogenase accessory factor
VGFAVHAADPEADSSAFPDVERVWTDLAALEAGAGSRTFAVVATMGERDEDALAAALRVAPAYLGVVASSRRFAQIRDAVASRGVSPADLSRVKSPAGLDIGARTPEEIAVSILAEIVQVRSAAGEARSSRGPELPVADVRDAIDPVCGMHVAVAAARHSAEHGGKTWYFCCGGCREKFLAAPERFPAPQAGIAGLGGTA